MMYLPYKSDQREEAIKLMVDMFELVLPEKISEETVIRNPQPDAAFSRGVWQTHRLPFILSFSSRDPVL
jgi:hypothetical protein